MEAWILPAVIASLSSAAVLALVYGYLYLAERSRFLLLLSSAWFLMLLRTAFQIGMLRGHGSVAISAGIQAAALLGAYCLLWGTTDFLKREFSRWWALPLLAGAAWIAAAFSFDMSFLALSLPTFVFRGLVLIVAGVVLLRSPEVKGMGKLVTGWALIIWGVHTADDPFLSPVPWFAPWVYLMSTILMLTVGMGMLIVYFQKTSSLLKESRRRFRSLFDHAGDAVFVHDVKGGRIVDANEEACRSLGYSREEILNMSAPDIEVGFSPEQIQEICQSLVPGEPVTVEGRHRRKDGSTFPVEVRLGLLDPGEPQMLIVLARDITERKTMEDALEERKRFYVNVFNCIQNGISILDRDLNIINVNRFMEERYAHAMPLVGKKCYQAYHGRTEACEVCPTKETLASGNPSVKLVPYVRDRIEGWLELYTYPLLDSKTGEVTGVIEYVADVTERKRAEEQLMLRSQELQMIFNTVPDIYFRFDDGATIIDYKAPNREDLYVPPSEFLGKRIVDVMPPDVGQRTVDMIADIQKTGNTASFEYTLPISGSERVFEARLFPFVEDQVIALVRDITSRKRAEEQIGKSLKEKEVLLREIHHRVKNNMQIILSLLKLQARQSSGSEDTEMLQESQNRIRAMALVHEELYRSRDLSHISVEEYVSSLARNLFKTYGVDPSRISLSIDVDDMAIGIDTAIPCGLIINELLSNSLKYAFPGGSKGEVSISIKPADKGYTLAVGDNGVGLPEGLDFRTAPTMGFQLVTALAEQQLGGSIELSKDGGTEFRITCREVKNGRMA